MKDPRVYLGLDTSIDKALQLSFAAGSSTNIPPQSAKGKLAGTMTIRGQVAVGAPTNNAMNLTAQLVMYSDIDQLTYDTFDDLPTLSMQLSKVPDGMLDGTLLGPCKVSGELEGTVDFAVRFTSALRPGPAGVMVERTPGTIHVTGSVTSDYDVHIIDMTL